MHEINLNFKLGPRLSETAVKEAAVKNERKKEELMESLAPAQWDSACLGKHLKELSMVTGHCQSICIMSQHIMDCQLLPCIYTDTQNPTEGRVSNCVRRGKEGKTKEVRLAVPRIPETSSRVISYQMQSVLSKD